MGAYEITGEFHVGQYVVYRNGAKYALGRITSLKQQCAFVCYHEGETAAATPYHTIHPLVNAYTIKSTTLGGDRFTDMEATE